MKNPIPELQSTVGKYSFCKNPNGSYSKWEVIDEIRVSEYDEKVLLLQKMKDINKPDTIMFRFCYYMFNKTRRYWVFGQFAPFIDSDDFTHLIKKAIKEKWFKL